MLVNFCQNFALMRMLSQSWAWPPFWRHWTAPMLLFNFDTPAFYYRDVDDGPQDLTQRDRASWPLYAGVWLGLVTLILLAGAHARFRLRPYHRRRHAYYRHTYFCLTASEVLFFPALL